MRLTIRQSSDIPMDVIPPGSQLLGATVESCELAYDRYSAVLVVELPEYRWPEGFKVPR